MLPWYSPEERIISLHSNSKSSRPQHLSHYFELETHEGWWQQIVDLWDVKNTAPITLTPEFGPPGYMHTLPFTNQPVADLWDVCLWMAKRLKGH